MTYSARIPGGIITFVESKAVCPHCEKHIDFDEIEKRFDKTENPHIRMKCSCGRFVGITANMMGDYKYKFSNLK